MRSKSTSNIRFLTKEESTELFNIIKADKSLHYLRNRTMFLVAKYCALRASELGLILVSDYNPHTHTLFCRRQKGSRCNTLKIVDNDICEILDSYYSQRILSGNTGVLFPSQLGNPISRKTLDWMMKNYCKYTSIPHDKHHFHTLKHTRAMELIEYDDIGLRDVQWWLGHKDINNTMIYLNYTDKTKRRLFEKISNYERGNFYEQC